MTILNNAFSDSSLVRVIDDLINGCSASPGDWYNGGRITVTTKRINANQADECIAHEFMHLVFDVRGDCVTAINNLTAGSNTNISTNNIPVYVTCVGDDLGLDSQCEEIGTGTCGFYVDSDTAANLPERFVSFYEIFKGRKLFTQVYDRFWNSSYNLTYPVEVEDGATSTSFVVLWYSEQMNPKMLVQDPNGSTYTGQSMPLGQYLHINNPMAGGWKIMVYGGPTNILPRQSYYKDGYVIPLV